jgi:hypothetical protein
MTLRELKSDAEVAREWRKKYLGHFMDSKELGPGGEDADVDEALTDLLTRRSQEAREAAHEEAAQAFEEEYCKHESPLLGVIRGVKAIRALSKAAEAKESK